MPDRPRILWLHTQPEHYHNCMIDELNARGNFEYVAGFSYRGGGQAVERPLPQRAQSIFLKPRPGMEGKPPGNAARYHLDWRKDVYPLDVDAVIIAGYGSATHREIIRDCYKRRIPVALFSDSNLRSQRGASLTACVKRRIKRLLLRGIIGKVELLLTANRLGVAYWRYFGAVRSKIVVCPYYGDYERVGVARRTIRADILRQHHLPENVRYIFSAARLVDAKALHLMIQAFHAAKLAEHEWHYLIAGSGPLEGALKLQAGPLLGKNIHFVGFQQPSDNLALMAHAALFALPSIYEPHGIVVAESLATGTPVLASDVCGAAADLVKPGISGDLFISGDAADLQKKLEHLLYDQKVLVELRRTTRLKFEQWFAAYSPIDIVDAAVARMLHGSTRQVSARHG